MKKLVNVDSPAILYVLTPPMSGLIQKIELDVKDIRYCLNRGAKVEEVLPDGTMKELTLDNYDQSTSIGNVQNDLKSEKEVPKVEDIVVDKKEEIEKEEVIEEKEEIVEEVKEDGKKNKGKKKKY